MKAYKTEIKPSEEQKQKINQSIGTCRWLYNQYVAKNIELYELYKQGVISKTKSFMSANDFDKYINHNVKTLDDYKWINICGSKARKKAIKNGETAFKNFFKGKSGFPKFKKKNKQDIKLYFPLNNKTDWKVDRHKINIPTLKWIRLKEKGYIPTNAKVISGTVSKKANRYYVSVVTDEVPTINNEPYTCGIGVDLGIKDTAICSNGKVFKNINKTSKIKQLEKRLKREQKKLSRKHESLKTRNKNIKKENATRQNIQKQLVKIQKLHQRLNNIRTDYLNKMVNNIAITKPCFITLEDLNIKGIMKNKYLSKAISKQKLYELKNKLTIKAKELEIEIREVDRFFPSSKMCNNCGNINKQLKLSDRTYKCSCGYIADRDLNASYNLRDSKKYKII